MMMNRAFVLALTAVLFAHAQSAPSPSTNPRYPSAEVWTFNFPQAPLKISADGDRSYSLRNTTKLATSTYRLGCVRRSDDSNFIVVHRMDVENTTIAPGKEWGVQAFHQNPEKRDCESRSARLTVIEVNFADGTVWQPSAKLKD